MGGSLFGLYKLFFPCIHCWWTWLTNLLLFNIWLAALLIHVHVHAWPLPNEQKFIFSNTLLPLTPTYTAAPRFTIKPNDLDLKIGNTVAISCAFNGQPAPSIIWRKDGEVVTSDKRQKVTSCATSSVLEISSLEHEDKGVYSCYVTNQLGSDSASMTLSLHGMSILVYAVHCVCLCVEVSKFQLSYFLLSTCRST